MKLFKNLLFFTLALLAGVLVAEAQPLLGPVSNLDALGVMVGAFTSLAGLKNIPEQTPNPAGGRRVYAILTADLADNVVDWPRVADITASEVTLAIPVKAGKVLAIIQPADNSLDAQYENQGDRYYQSFKHSLMFDIAALTKEQITAASRFVNAGAIFLVEEHDDTIKVYGTKLNPIILKQKGQLGKKGGDKNGMSFSGDNDSFMFAPPVYKSTLALPLASVTP